MSNMQRIEQEILSLSPDELANFRKWFTAFDSAQWDQQLERDVQAGKLDGLRDEAIAEYASHRTKEL